MLLVVLFLAAHRHASVVRLYVGINQDEISIEETYASLSEPMRQTYESLSYVVSVRLIVQSKTERTEYVSIILSLHADPHPRQVGDADRTRVLPPQPVDDCRFLLHLRLLPCAHIPLPPSPFPNSTPSHARKAAGKPTSPTCSQKSTFSTLAVATNCPPAGILSL